MQMHDESTLKARAVRGFAWVMTFSFVARGAQYLAFLIMAKLLVPEDFGAFALGLILVNALIMFREMGLTPALIQRQENVEKAFGVGMVLLPLYGIGLFVIIFFLSVPFAKLVNNPSIVPVVRVLGLSVPISSLGILPAAWFQRQIDFKRKAIPEIISAVMGAGFSVILAAVGWGVWSLVWGKVATELLRTIAYWVSSGWRWRPIWDAAEARRLFRFGSIVSLGSMTDFLYYLVDQMMVGKYMGEKALGFYSFAFRNTTLPVTGLTVQLGQVMLPVMSRLQNDLSHLSRVVGKNIALNALITVPFCAGVFFFGGDLLQIFYGHKWDGAIVLLRILALYGFFWTSIGPMINAYIALGKASYFPLVSTIKLVLALVGMLWAIPKGNPEAVAHIFTWVSLVCYLYGYYLGAKLLNRSIWYLLSFMLPYTVAVLPGYLALKLMAHLKCCLIIEIFVFYLVYFAFVLIFGKETIKEIRDMIKSIFQGEQSESGI